MLLLYNNNAFTNQKDSFYFAINKPLFLNGLAIALQHLFGWGYTSPTNRKKASTNAIVNAYYVYSLLSFLLITAGLPATTQSLGMSCITKLPAAIIHLSPMVTPGKITTEPPIHVSSPIVIGKQTSCGLRRSK